MVDLNRIPSPPRDKDFSNRFMAYGDKFFRYLKNISRKPVPLQMAVGSGSGFILGYFCTKGSKLFALLLGCSFIVIQFFNYRGYIRFHRTQFQEDIDSVSNKIKKHLGYRQGFPSSHEMDDFLTRYSYLFSSFVCGNLIGYGMA
uniref:Fun14 family protein n=1 Tax=Panagrolaimus superbus TaxID=310955 RepID=A0A914Y074_9BILA